MDLFTHKQRRIVVTLIDFKDTCKAHGQNGIVSAGIISALKECFDEKTIDLIKKEL